MNNLIKLLLLSLVIILSVWVGYMQYYTIPDLKDINRESTDSTRVIIPGPVDTLEIFRTDTVYVTRVDSIILDPDTDNNSQTRNYRTLFSDNYISGTVYSEVIGTLESSRVEYFYKKEIASTRQIDTKVITVTNNYVREEKLPPFTLNAGLMVGVPPTLDKIYIGPSLGINTRGGDHISLSYDLANDAYFISYKSRIKFPKISLF